MLERRIYEYKVLAERSEAEAVQFMSEGNEPAARLAVMAKLRYTESGQECTAGLQETQAALASLEVQLAGVKEEHTRLKAKRAELAERARKAAEIKQAAQASASSFPAGYGGHVLNAGSAARGFERMEDKIAMQEALAEQSGLAAAAAPDAPLNSAVEAELERLRNCK